MPSFQPLKIAFITSKFPVLSETFISRKVDSLLDRGHKVGVFCAKFDRKHHDAAKYGPYIYEMPNLGKWVSLAEIPYCLTRLLLTHPAALARVFASPRKAMQRLYARTRLDPSRWDVIHFHYLKNADIIEGLFPGQQTPCVAGVYGYDVSVLPYRPGGMTRTQARVRAATAILYSSDFLRKSLHDLVDFSMTESVIHPEIPSDAFPFRRRERCSVPCRILSIGRLHWAKGYAFALTSIRLLLQRGLNCRYAIVGDGPAREELEYSIRTMGLSEHVELLGAKTPNEVAAEIDRSDILFQPSIKEEFGIVLLEAQASGLPIVASKVGGIAEAVHENETALLVPDRDVVSASEALARLMNEPDLYRGMNERGPLYAAKFDVSVIGDKLVDFYRSLIASQAQPD